MLKTYLFFLILSINCFNCTKIHHKRINQNQTSRYQQSSIGSSSSSSNVYRYEPIHLLEEPPIGTLIIDLANKLGLNLDTSDYKFRFYSPQSVVSNYFLIDQLTGHVKTQRTIDREYLCETKICGQCLTSNCTLTLEIVASLPYSINITDNLPKQKFVSFDVVIEDKNEFAPQFTQSTLVLNISEAAPLNFQIPIEGAIDRDSQFTQITYSLAPILTKSSENSNNNNVVNDDPYVDNERYINELKKLNSKIKLSTSPFSNQLNIVLTEPFDYEREKEYKFKILATDNGWPTLTGTCVVKLNILDINDNLPIFERQEYEYRIDEGVTPGTRLVRVHASDKDDGLNGLIKYSFAEQQVASSQLVSLVISQSTVDTTTKLFHVDENTGWISSNTYLDYEYQPIYRLVVKAQDQGINSMPVYASVIIYLNDLNDNAPVINLTVADDSYKYDNDRLYISEWTQPGTFLAQIIVSDADSGLNGRVDIDLQELNNELVVIESSTFFIEHLFNNFYSLILKQAVDRENISEFNLLIKAHDYGKSMLSTIKPLKIIIVDENDNQPEFVYMNANETFYRFSIVEAGIDSSVGWSYLGKIDCVDKDAGENGRIGYRLAENETFFRVNETTGDVTVLQSKIDRETHGSLEFKVICEDNSGGKKLKSESFIKVSVVDLNDNKPIFDQEKYTFNIDENLNVYTKITQFNAIDADEALTLNSKVSYRISDSNYFSVNSETGELFLIKPLDYEHEKFYEFFIYANDLGTPMLESEKVAVRINILDVNDNAPVLQWPLDIDLPLVFNLDQLYENYINYKNMKFELFQLSATDDDSNENGILKYTIEKQQKLNFINDDTNQFRTNIHLFECGSQNGSINGLFFKRFKSVINNFEDLIGIYYLEIKIQDSAKINPLHKYAQIFLTLNTNTSGLDDDIKLIKLFLNNTKREIFENNDEKLTSLKTYVYNSFNLNSKFDYIDYNDIDNKDTSYQFLESIFSFGKGNNRSVELLFGANYKFILLIISIFVFIFLFIIISVSVVICYRRQKSLFENQKQNKSTKPASEIININDNLLSSLIDLTSQTSSEDNKPKDLQKTETIKRINKLRATLNDYELNVSSEDQTALLLYSNSPSSTSSSNRQTISTASNVSKPMGSIDNIDENSSNLRTFKNVTVESYNHKYYTLPLNRLSATGNLVNSGEENYTCTMRAKVNPKITFIKNNYENNDLYSLTTNQMVKTLKEGNTEVCNENVGYEILNRNKYQKQNEIPEYFFKNKKELICKNNIIDCKRLELPDETD
jgi:hypothetical protein